MTRLIIFDFDGTLGDTRATIVYTMQATMRRLGLPVAGEAEIAATIGLPLEEGFAQLIPSFSPEDCLHCAAVYRAIFDERCKATAPELFPHVKETLDILHRRGHVMTVASSRLSRTLLAFLKDMGIAPYFSYVIGADNVPKAKPDPEPVLQTLCTLGFSASEATVVGDMPVDILMGRRAGARTCGVTYGNASRVDLEAAGADVILDDFADMVKL